MEIDYAGLTTAFQDANTSDYSYWLNTQTGDVLIVDDWSEGEARQLASPYDTDNLTIRLAWCVLWQDGEIGVEEQEEEDERIVDALMESFIQVPQADTREGYNLMVDFAATVRDPHLRELLEVALDGRGAFRRFRDVLARYPDERERWFEFRDNQTRRQIDAWLEAVGVLGGSKRARNPPPRASDNSWAMRKVRILSSSSRSSTWARLSIASARSKARMKPGRRWIKCVDCP